MVREVGHVLQRLELGLGERIVVGDPGARVQQGPSARVRPDVKVVFFDEWEQPEERLEGATAILRNLANLAQPAKAA